MCHFYPVMFVPGYTQCKVCLSVGAVQSCQRLQYLSLDHIKELGEDSATALCRTGLRQLQRLELSGTPITANTLKTFYSQSAVLFLVVDLFLLFCWWWTCSCCFVVVGGLVLAVLLLVVDLFLLFCWWWWTCSCCFVVGGGLVLAVLLLLVDLFFFLVLVVLLLLFLPTGVQVMFLHLWRSLCTICFLAYLVIVTHSGDLCCCCATCCAGDVSQSLLVVPSVYCQISGRVGGGGGGGGPA